MSDVKKKRTVERIIVLGDLDQAAPYISLTKRLFASYNQRKVKRYRQKLGNAGEWSIDITVMPDFLKAIIIVEGKPNFYTVFETVSSIPSSGGNFFVYQYRLAMNKTGAKLSKYRANFVAGVITATTALDTTQFAPYLGKETSLWRAFQFINGSTFIFNLADNYYISYGSLTGADYGFQNNVFHRVFKLRGVLNSTKIPTQRDPVLTASNSAGAAITESFPVISSKAFYVDNIIDTRTQPANSMGLDAYPAFDSVNYLNALTLAYGIAPADGGGTKPVIIVCSRQGESSAAYGGRNATPISFHRYPAWSFSLDNGVTWTDRSMVLTSMPSGVDFTQGDYSDLAHVASLGASPQVSRRLEGGRFYLVKKNLYRAYTSTFERFNFSTGVFPSTVPNEQAFFGSRVVTGSFTSSDFTTFDSGAITLLDSHISDVAALTSPYRMNNTLVGLEGSLFAAGAKVYNLGDGRMILAGPKNLAYAYQADSELLPYFNSAVWALYSDDYGATFTASQEWGAGYNYADGYVPSVLAAGVNFGLVIGRGCMWRVQFSPTSTSSTPSLHYTYDATFYRSIDGGNTWTSVARPLPGLIDFKSLSNPVLLTACPDVAIDNPARGTMGSFAINVYDVSAQKWTLMVTKDSGDTWQANGDWVSGTVTGVASTGLSAQNAVLPYGVLDD